MQNFNKILIIFFLTITIGSIEIYSQNTTILLKTTPEIKGESQISGNVDQIELYQLSYNTFRERINNPAGSTSLYSDSRTNTFSITKRIDKASVELFSRFLGGSTLDKFEIFHLKQNGGSNGLEEYMRYELKDVIISSITTLDNFNERIELSCSSFNWGYKPTDPVTGNLESTSKKAGWNFNTNLVELGTF